MNLGCGERRKSSHPDQSTSAVAITNSVIAATYRNSPSYVASLTLFLSAQASRPNAERYQFSIPALTMVQSVLLNPAGCILNPLTGHRRIDIPPYEEHTILFFPNAPLLSLPFPFHTLLPESINTSPFQTLLAPCPTPQYLLPRLFSWTHAHPLRSSSQ